MLPYAVPFVPNTYDYSGMASQHTSTHQPYEYTAADILAMQQQQQQQAVFNAALFQQQQQYMQMLQMQALLSMSGMGSALNSGITPSLPSMGSGVASTLPGLPGLPPGLTPTAQNTLEHTSHANPEQHPQATAEGISTHSNSESAAHSVQVNVSLNGIGAATQATTPAERSLYDPPKLASLHKPRIKHWVRKAESSGSDADQEQIEGIADSAHTEHHSAQQQHTQHVKEVEQQLQEQREANAKQVNDLQQLQQRIEELKTSDRKLQQLLLAAQSTLNKTALDRNEVQQRLDVVQEEHRKLTEEHTKLQSEHHRRLQDHDKLSQEHDKVQKERNQLMTQRDKLTKERDQVAKAGSQAMLNYQDAKQQLDKLHRQLQQQRDEMQHSKQEVQELQQQMDVLVHQQAISQQQSQQQSQASQQDTQSQDLQSQESKAESKATHGRKGTVQAKLERQLTQAKEQLQHAQQQAQQKRLELEVKLDAEKRQNAQLHLAIEQKIKDYEALRLEFVQHKHQDAMLEGIYDATQMSCKEFVEAQSTLLPRDMQAIMCPARCQEMELRWRVMYYIAGRPLGLRYIRQIQALHNHEMDQSQDMTRLLIEQVQAAYKQIDDMKFANEMTIKRSEALERLLKTYAPHVMHDIHQEQVELAATLIASQIAQVSGLTEMVVVEPQEVTKKVSQSKSCQSNQEKAALAIQAAAEIREELRQRENLSPNGSPNPSNQDQMRIAAEIGKELRRKDLLNESTKKTSKKLEKFDTNLLYGTGTEPGHDADGSDPKPGESEKVVVKKTVQVTKHEEGTMPSLKLSMWTPEEIAEKQDKLNALFGSATTTSHLNNKKHQSKEETLPDLFLPLSELHDKLSLDKCQGLSQLKQVFEMQRGMLTMRVRNQERHLLELMDGFIEYVYKQQSRLFLMMLKYFRKDCCAAQDAKRADMRTPAELLRDSVFDKAKRDLWTQYQKQIEDEAAVFRVTLPDLDWSEPKSSEPSNNNDNSNWTEPHSDV